MLLLAGLPRRNSPLPGAERVGAGGTAGFRFPAEFFPGAKHPIMTDQNEDKDKSSDDPAGPVLAD